MNAVRFAFAKQYGVIVDGETDNVTKVLYHCLPPSFILAEIRRYLQMPIYLEQVSEEKFNQLLVASYETDSATAMQMVEDLGEAINLSDMLHQLPKAEDLLETQDDAPIIRLLNA